MVPESSDLLVVCIIPIMLLFIDDAVSVPITKSKFMVDEGLEAHEIADNVVQTVKLGCSKL